LIILQIATDDKSIPAKDLFDAWLQSIEKTLHWQSGEITLRIIDQTESRSLNYQFRQKDSATNVLSFPSSLPQDIAPDYLGDIAMCAPVIEQEAKQQHKSLNAHWAHMLVHGVLHLRGYDHIDQSEANEMESLESEILKNMGYSNPYS
jgi:probable rRNA maturation factor